MSTYPGWQRRAIDQDVERMWPPSRSGPPIMMAFLYIFMLLVLVSRPRISPVPVVQPVSLAHTHHSQDQSNDLTLTRH